MRKPTSLADYSVRRFNLASGGLLATYDPFFVPVDAARNAREKNGEPWTSFAHYDYLDLHRHPAIEAAAKAAIDEHGMGTCASRVVGGERLVHRALESDIAKFVGSDDALAMVSGYGTNASLVGHLLTSADLIVYDEYAHNSILAGVNLSRAESIPARHNDLDHLASTLAAKRSSYRRALVVVEGLYSMDGDIADLPRILELCRRHDAWLMIDEAHSIGVLGASGRGLCEHFGIDAREVDIIVGTLSKAFAHSGGFICAKTEVIKWLRYTLPGFVYSVGLAPLIAAGVRTAFAVASVEPERVQRLHKISRYFVAKARALDFDVGKAIGCAVVPVMMPSSAGTVSASASLFNAGIYVPPIIQLGVPKDKPRLRFFLTSRHNEAEVDRALHALSAWRSAWQEPSLIDQFDAPVAMLAAEAHVSAR